MKGIHLLLGLLAAAALAVVIGIATVASTNDALVVKDEAASTALANVQVQYQRRTDLIPNLVSTVKGYAAHEDKVLTEVTQARANVGGINLDPATATPEQISEFMAAQNQLSGALSRLMLVVENYPDLKASEQFLTLQAQLEGTENRIAVERKRYNEAVDAYNTKRRSFFTKMIVNMFLKGEFPKDKYHKFQADEGAQKVPTVDFGL